MLERVEDKVQRLQGKGSGSQDLNSETEAFAKILKSINFPEKHKVFDIGANFGKWTENCLDKVENAHFYLFEPSEFCFKNLISKFSSNEKITVYHYALGDTEKSTFLYSDFPGSGLSSLYKRDLNYLDIYFNYEESIKMITIDSFVEESKIVPTALKIDVEGHELAVLQGAINTLKDISLIQFEFGGSNIDSKVFFKDIYKFLQKNSFTIYRLSNSKLIPISQYKEIHECFRVTTLYAKK